MHGESILVDIGLAIVAATVLAYVARLLRQPLLLGYIGAGLLIGPPILGLIQNEETISQLGELGLAFLMFIVGLEIDIKKLVSSGRVGALVGRIQVKSPDVVLISAISWCLIIGYLAMQANFSIAMGASSLASETITDYLGPVGPR